MEQIILQLVIKKFGPAVVKALWMFTKMKMWTMQQSNQ